MIEIKQLEYFTACIEYGSFSEAAKALYTTQSNVSKVILQLEKQIKLVLFVRKRRGIELTERGKIVYAYARQVLRHTELLEQYAAQAETEEGSS